SAGAPVGAEGEGDERGGAMSLRHWTQEEINRRNVEVFGAQAPASAPTDATSRPGGAVEKSPKYRNIRKEVDGVVFDSCKEAKRYVELKALEKAFVICHLQLQPEFILQEKKNGVRAIKYRADFKYVEHDTYTTVVEDVKGMRTAAYRIKAKLFRAK